VELLCPAGNLPSLRAAVDAGADSVYLGFRDATNARHFAGLNFSDQDVVRGIRYAHDRRCKVLIALNTYPQPAGWSQWTRAVDRAAASVDALILADTGLLDYAAERWPEVHRHLSVQASATNPEALRLYHRLFGITRAVIPRVLSLKQVAQGGGAVARAGRGLRLRQPVRHGGGPLPVVELPDGPLAQHLRRLLARLARPLAGDARRPGNAAQRRADRPLRPRREGRPTPPCARAASASASTPTTPSRSPAASTPIELLPELYRAGVAAIKVEGRQRSPAYVAQVTGVMRAAIDACIADPDNFRPTAAWQKTLAAVSEGTQTTLGAYHRSWQ
jgi:O2-independent ubiquinone biosynthesis protein UbiU